MFGERGRSVGGGEGEGGTKVFLKEKKPLKFLEWKRKREGFANKPVIIHTQTDRNNVNQQNISCGDTSS